MEWYLEEAVGGRKIPLPQGITAVGRTPNCAIKLDSNYCSRKHCNFEVDVTGIVRVVDFSTNGTFVNGECYGNMNVTLSEGDKIGIGCWPFEGYVVPTCNMPVYYLRKERALETAETIEDTPVIQISEPSLETTPQSERPLPIGSCQNIGIQEAAEVINISDDEEDGIDLDKYAIVGQTNGSRVPGNHSTLSVKMEVDEVEEPPQFLEPGTSMDRPTFLPQRASISLEMDPNMNAEFLPSVTSSQNHSTSNTVLDHNADKNQTSNLKPLENQNHKDEEDMDIDDILSQSILLDIKQEIADYETEQSLELKSDANSLSREDQSKENYFGTASHNEVDPVNNLRSPIFVVDSDDENEEEEDATFSKWAQKLSQSFVSSQRSTGVPEDGGETKNQRHSDNIDTLTKKLRRSLSLEDVSSESTDKDNAAEEQKSIRKTRYSSRRIESPKESKLIETKDSCDKASTSLKKKSLTKSEPDKKLSESTDSIDSKEVKPNLKHKLEPIKPKPSTSRQAREEEQESIYFEAKRKKLELIDAPFLPTGRGKLRGRSASSATSPSDVEHKFKTIRQSERFNSHEKNLKDKWHQKPSLERHEQKRRKLDIQEERKVKLKELADKQAQKRKLDSAEPKVAKKPKVKVTDRNRGAYLAEDCEAAKQQVLSKKIPKISSKPSNKVAAEKSSTSCAVCEEVPKVEGKQRRKSSTSNETDKSLSLESQKTPRRKTSELKSILKTPGTSLKRKPKVSVRFLEKPEIRFFDIDPNNNIGRKVDCKDAPMDKASFKIMEQAQMRVQDATPWVDNSDIILSDILSWDPKWLDNQKPEVNGLNHLLMPMMQQYTNFEDFSRIVLPLFKIELWHSIEQDYKRRVKKEFAVFQVNQFFIDKRGKNSRYVFHCEANAKQIRDKMDFTSYQLCIVKVGNESAVFQVFGIITSMKCLVMKASQEMISLQIELLANITHKQIFEKARNIRIKPITNIRVEVGVYNAVTNIQVSPLGQCILNPFELVRTDNSPPQKIRYKGYNELNTNQHSILLKAYQKCINTEKCNNLFMIEGPPGTGKSRLITNLALQILYGDEVRKMARKKRILICAQSNAAVDIIVLKLLEIRGKMDRDKFNLVRFGVFERIHQGVRCVSLQSLVQSQFRDKQTEANRNVLRQERKLLESQIDKLNQSAGPSNVSRDELQKKKDRLTMINQLLGVNTSMAGQEAHFPKFLAGAHIVCTTLSSCIKLLNYTKKFDVCIIDEATQSAEPYTLIPLQFGISSLILVGDTQQLPATVLSSVSEEYGFGTSLFTRIQKCLEGNKNSPIQMLKTQYRMHPEICNWSNSYFYKEMLINHESTKGASVVKPYSVFNLEYSDSFEEDKGKLINKHEAKFVVQLVSKLAETMSPEYFSYGIITPYSHHKDYLQKKIDEAGIKRVFVNTIDSYQGMEKDVVILSCVRTRGVGFLGNCQRLNVAMTRAKKCLLVCGNFSSLMREPVWKSLIENAKRRNLYHNIKEKDAEDFENKVMCHLRTIILPAESKT